MPSSLPTPLSAQMEMPVSIKQLSRLAWQCRRAYFGDILISAQFLNHLSSSGGKLLKVSYQSMMYSCRSSPRRWYRLSPRRNDAQVAIFHTSCVILMRLMPLSSFSCDVFRISARRAVFREVYSLRRCLRHDADARCRVASARAALARYCVRLPTMSAATRRYQD